MQFQTLENLALYGISCSKKHCGNLLKPFKECVKKHFLFPKGLYEMMGLLWYWFCVLSQVERALCLPAPLPGLSIKIILAQHTHSISVHCHEGGSKYPNHIGKTHLVLWLVLHHPAGITDQLTRANMKCETLMVFFLEINTCSSSEERHF